MNKTHSMPVPALSIVTPVFNEEDIVEEFYRRVQGAVEPLGMPFEVIFVNDGSRDETLHKLEKLRSQDDRVKVVGLSRNFGHQNAISAGLAHVGGQVCVMMDADLQDPPELIPELLKRWRDGYAVVYAVREARAGETIFKRSTAALFYRLMRAMSGVDIPLDAGDFRLMDRQIVDILNALPERNHFLRGLICWIGFRQIGVSYKRPERFAGETKFSLWKMLRFAADGITSFSRMPLRMVSGMGFGCFFISVFMLAWVLLGKLFFARSVQGWTSMIAVVLFLGGCQLLALGVIGEYIARIFDEAKQRPRYIIQHKLGL